MAEDGWKQEAMQLRKNHSHDRAAISAFVDLFESNIDRVDSPLLCLALHHIAMSFHVCAGKKTVRKMNKADLEALPGAIYPADRIVNLDSAISGTEAAKGSTLAAQIREQLKIRFIKNYAKKGAGE